MLAVRSLEVSYDAVRAVDGIDLDVGAGEAVALLGANGAGKSSTLRAISGLCARSGTIEFDGGDITRTAPQRIAQRGLIHVPEGRHVFPNLSVHENLQMGTTARRGRDGWALADVYELFPPLVPLRSRAGWQLSGGEQQMVALGRALMSAPRLLLLDEPTLGLAPSMVLPLRRAIATIVESVPILMVEQNSRLALELCHRAYVLSAGRVALAGSSTDLGAGGALLDTFIERDPTAPTSAG